MVSRALDDREISLQKQSRVFFQISGAGHEALLLGLARELRPGYDWFFPYYRDRALCSASGSAPTRSCCRRWARRRPVVGRAPDAGALGLRRARTSSPSRARREVSACRRSAARRRRATSRGAPTFPAASAHGDEITYVSLGEGATSEGEFWESLNTACTLHLPVLYVVADNGYAISVPASDQAPAPIYEMVRGFRGLDDAQGRRLRLLRGAPSAPQGDRPRPRRRRPGADPRQGHPAVFALGGRHAGKYRSTEELADEAARDPILACEHELVEAGVLTGRRGRGIRAEAIATVADAARQALAARASRPGDRSRDHVVRAAVDSRTAASPSDDGEVVAFGEASSARCTR